MKPFPRPFLSALGFLFAAALAFAAAPSPEARVARLHELVTLTADQQSKIAEVFRKEDAALLALQSRGQRPLDGIEARQESRERVRALLTPAQRKIYDRAPQIKGGGLNLPTAEMKVANLDKTVGLTAAQKTVARQVYDEEFEALVSLSPAERPMKGMDARQAARDQIRALLTPDQLKKLDDERTASLTPAVEEKAAIENALRASASMANRIGALVSLSWSSASSSTDSNGNRKGVHRFKAVGATSSENLVVTWEAPAGGSLKLTRVETAGGEPLSL